MGYSRNPPEDPLQPPNLFRKSALERLSTPEQLDRLIEVATPHGWLALGAIGGLLAAVLVWSVVGRIPTTITGKCILLPPRGVDEVYATGSGFVSEVLVKEGDLVVPGQIVARIEEQSQTEKARGSKRESALRLSALAQKIPFLETQAKAKKEAVAMGLLAPVESAQAVEALASARTELETLRNQASLQDVQFKGATEVRALKEGRVVEVVTSPSTLIQAGSPVLTLSSEKEETMALIFIANHGDRAKPGMDAEISPVSFPKQEFGFLRAKVAYVSDLPVRTHMLFELTRNPILNEYLTKEGDPFFIQAALQKDPSTPSGYAWSSSRGPDEKVKAGMLGEARIVVERRRPITLAIPAMKSLLGL
jgi:HlyD family secretion protein